MININTAREWRRPVGAYLALALIGLLSFHRTFFSVWAVEDVAALTALGAMWSWDNLMRSQEIRARNEGSTT